MKITELMKPFTLVASVVFAAVALLHLLRLWYTVEITIGTYHLPYLVSFGGFIVTALLSMGLWKEAFSGKKSR